MRIVAIVPAHNAARDIGACLDGLLGAGFAPSDIVVVDDGSTDATAMLASARRVVVIQHPCRDGAAAARNRGRAAAGHADVLMFLDADVVPAADARRVVEHFFTYHPGHAALFGAYDEDPAVRTTTSRFRNLLHRHVHRANGGEAVTFWTGLGAVRAADFDAVGGFEPGQRMMEDIRLGLALHARGARIRLDPRLTGQHRKGWTVAGMCSTDLFDRAIPWARLLRTDQGRASASVLNLNATARVSAASVAGSLAAAVLGFRHPRFGTALALASLAVLVAANRRFVGEQRQLFGTGQAVAATPLLWLHYGCGGVGYAWVASEAGWSRLRAAVRPSTRTLRDRIARR